jgi:formate hydrogenlyase transcriptional activator
MSTAPQPPPAESVLQQYRALLEVSESIISHRDLSGLFHDLAQRLQRVVGFDTINLILHNSERGVMHLHVQEAVQHTPIPCRELAIDASPGGWVWRHQQALLIPDLEQETRWPQLLDSLRAHGVRSACALPLTTARRRLGAVGFTSSQAQAYGATDLDFLGQVAKQVAVAVDNALAFEQIAALKDQLAQEKLYLEEELRTEHNFEEIIGESPGWKRVLHDVALVAPTDSAVLIHGETGTGKELIARALHDRSRRRQRTFVKLNCAAIPTGLLESELFGHEKGAFTGAVARKVGRFELAHHGTLFLDEVGDLPLELQPKLLRVLQEQEFERLGGTQTLRVDVRLIAATNRDLARMVAERQFRSDLYYRLNVFPLALPPLRARRADIPLLVRYWTHTCARRMGRRIETIPAAALDALCRYAWPGNIRELQNVIERAVILSPGPELRVPVDELKAPVELSDGAPGGTPTLEDVERAAIVRALREANWVVGGPSGAAARLGLNRTTLHSRMRKLNIRRPK